MKKIILLITFIFVSIISFADSTSTIVTIDSPYGPKQVVVPNDPKELEAAYLKMASLYLQERFAGEQALKKIDELLSIEDAYRRVVSDYAQLLKDVEKPSIYNSMFSIGWGMTLYNNSWLQEIYIMYQAKFYNRFLLNVNLKFPIFGFGLGVGIIF